MSENCNHDCSSCSKSCSERTIPHEKQNDQSKIKKIIGVVSGKGGVGKSFVTGLLSVLAKSKGYNVGILDADITGPSIPKMFGIDERAISEDGVLLNPCLSLSGIKVMSINLLLEHQDDPVVWRGPVIAGTVKQFYTDVAWGDIDYMFVDMPPGTGDVPLTVFQSLPIDGIVIVSSPQDLVAMIVGKAVKMAKLMNVPILGLVENMSYLECPDCGKKLEVFGKSKAQEIAKLYGIEKYAKLPINPSFADSVDKGEIESLNAEMLLPVFNQIEKK